MVGSANGPKHASNTFNVVSQGAVVSDNVDFVPWLNDDGTDTDLIMPGFQPAGDTSFAPVTTNDSPTGKYSSIDTAVDAVTAGGIVSAVAGTYTEQVSINHNLKLVGAGAETTIIDGDGDDVLTITSAVTNVEVSGFTITNGNKGIYAPNSFSNAMINIHDIVVTNNEGEGIYFNGALESTLTFTNVTVTDNDDDGIYLSGDSASLSDTTVTITGGEISNNDGNGIYVNNLISGSTLTIEGVMIGDDENGNSDNGIYVNNASNSTINIQNENTISWNGGNGVYLCAEGQCYDTNITIDDNDIKNNGEWGVNFYYIGLDNDSSTVDISNNTIDENDAGGIYIAETGSMEDPEGTLEITIDDNDITNNAGPGIWLGDVTGVAITNNFISGNGSGETTGIVVNSATGNFAHFNQLLPMSVMAYRAMTVLKL